jgi:hypothetical protein
MEVNIMLGAKKRPQGTFDSDLLLKADYALGANAGTVYGDGTDATGTDPIVLDVGTGLFKGTAVFDVSAIVVGGGEVYNFSIDGGVAANFTAGAPLASLTLGAHAAITGLSANDRVGRYTLSFTNERNGTFYRFLRLRITTVEGTANATFIAYII